MDNIIKVLDFFLDNRVDMWYKRKEIDLGNLTEDESVKGGNIIKRKLITILSVGITSIIIFSGCSNTKHIPSEVTNSPTTEETKIDEEDKDLIEISKDDLIEKISESEEVWVYVGRPNCKDCQEYYPRLHEYLEKTEKDILYLNTHVKTSQKEDIVTFLAENGVDEVPAIMHWIDSEVEKVYDMQNEKDIQLFENEYELYGGSYEENEN